MQSTRECLLSTVNRVMSIDDESECHLYMRNLLSEPLGDWDDSKKHNSPMAQPIYLRTAKFPFMLGIPPLTVKIIKSHLSVLRLSYLSVLRLTDAVWRLWRARRPLTRLVSPGNTSFLMPRALFCHVSREVLAPPPLSRGSDSESFRQFSKTSVRAVDLRETRSQEIYCSIGLKISKHFICLWSITI